MKTPLHQNESDLQTDISCPMCGHRFNPAEHLTCQACPLQKGCQMVCCPNCGYETVDVNGSKLASWISGLFRKDPQIHHKVNGEHKGPQRDIN